MGTWALQVAHNAITVYVCITVYVSATKCDFPTTGALAATTCSEEEDGILRRHEREHGARKWNTAAASLGHLGHRRTATACSNRWHYQLDPTINKDPWTQQEEAVLAKAYQQLGHGHWTEIAKLLPGRTSEQVSNRIRNAQRARGKATKAAP
ncbi:Homeodomain-like protein [Tribonema minus]|uniref:Homeodomain-like protein n=1 Tax=Tribonema minus TaxID=303371 RepID=A0A835Z5Q9_9STRA|nr:Homeodomain-like protein [Tribonema minus]